MSKTTHGERLMAIETEIRGMNDKFDTLNDNIEKRWEQQEKRDNGQDCSILDLQKTKASKEDIKEIKDALRFFNRMAVGTLLTMAGYLFIQTMGWL